MGTTRRCAHTHTDTYTHMASSVLIFSVSFQVYRMACMHVSKGITTTIRMPAYLGG